MEPAKTCTCDRKIEYRVCNDGDARLTGPAIENGALVVKVNRDTRRRRYSWEQLLEGITRENYHQEIDWDRPAATKPGEACADAGDFIWIDLDPIKDHEQRGRLPALVLSPLWYHERPD
jgi:hypothetical protein